MAKLNNAQRKHLVDRVNSMTIGIISRARENILGTQGAHLSYLQIFNGIKNGTITYRDGTYYRFEDGLVIGPDNQDLKEVKQKESAFEDYKQKVIREQQILEDKIMFMDNTDVLDLLAEFESKFN